MEKTAEKKASKFALPHIYVMIFIIICLMAVLTYVIPAGQYTRIPGPSGREMIDPNSYTRIEQHPVGIFDVFTAIL